jgi:hypothetical protein
MIFGVGLILVLGSILWADIHFVLAVFRAGQWWDVIPLIGMGVLSYWTGWVLAKVWQMPEPMERMRNALSNLATLLRFAPEQPRGNEVIDRLTLPPDAFDRQLRARP